MMLMLASMIAINAQSLTGKQWYTVMPADGGQDVVVGVTFEESGTCELLIAAQQEVKEKEGDMPITITAGVSVPGTYKHKGDKLKINFDRDKAEADVDYEIEGIDAATKALVDEEIRPQLEGLKDELKKEMLNGMPEIDDLKIVELTATRLVVKDSAGDEMTFNAK